MIKPINCGPLALKGGSTWFKGSNQRNVKWMDSIVIRPDVTYIIRLIRHLILQLDFRC